MRHLLAIPAICAILLACATPQAPEPPRPGPYTLAMGQSAPLARGLILTWEGVDDSRCPPDVQCIWAGYLAYRFSLRREGGAPEAFALTWGRDGQAPTLLGGAGIALDESMPKPAHGAAGTSPVTVLVKPQDSAPPSTSPDRP